ncbi:MAG: P-loop NTPase [Alphaproteobacteria bacterium]|nr:P-loop NTPase [Alphaproteobacteria bacterium]
MAGKTTRGTIPIVNIVCYSYKGGSGRSTATVNIAFELARQGKLVACLDMDIGAPGLHMIMGDWNTDAKHKIERNAGEVGHQCFLNEAAPGSEAFERLEPAMLDVRKCVPTALEGIGGGDLACAEGALQFLFSSTRQRTLHDLAKDQGEVRRFVEKYSLLQEMLAAAVGGRKDREVYLLVDAPNGITPVSLPLLQRADLVLMFYRHSLQHVEGTIDAGRKLIHYLTDERDRRYLKVLLVGSCVPEPLIETLLAAREQVTDGYARDMLDRFVKIRDSLTSFQNRYHGAIRKLSEDIVEDQILKVLEQPLTAQLADDLPGFAERVNANETLTPSN